MRRSWIRRQRMLLVTLSVLGGLMLSTELRADPPGDWAITTAVEGEIEQDPVASLDGVTVRTSNGIVQLVGKVSNILARERLTTLTETVRGVRAVINRVTVKPLVERTDAAVQADVKLALLEDPAVRFWKIGASVSDGVVTLKGTVGSWAQKRLAERVAKGVSGVKDVENSIRIRYQKKRTDAQIRKEVKRRLRWDALVDHALVAVRVRAGVVSLSGIVGSAAEKRRARTDAWIAGVKRVVAKRLQVKKWMRDPMLRKGKYRHIADAKVGVALKTALIHDPRVSAFKVSVHVKHGIATLRGIVDNRRAKQAAAEVAQHTVGVRILLNRLKVRPKPRDSKALTRAVRVSLRWSPLVDAADVKVKVKGSTVVLTGTVDSYLEKGHADDVASRVYGVAKVNNRLKVNNTRVPLIYNPYLGSLHFYLSSWYTYQPWVTFRPDAKIKRKILAELFWNPFVNDTDVNVKVNQGIATLTGKVDSKLERDAAVEEAYEGGAAWVINKIKVAQ